ncbi:MAG: nuclear transport factor 2 family protein [Saprospiraceae bacterium]|nr:nuclear transport factor 2 family protein [Saprospiraceae bacterium]MDW8228199.1 nuclear transport factor 2 family protein [Saprospiraceae bacterium]
MTAVQSVVETIAEHYQAIVDKNLPGILDKYVPSEETYVILEGPRLTTIGFEKIRKGWMDFCQSAIELQGIEWLEGPFHQQTDSMAWVAGIIRLCVSVSGRAFENIFRATFVLVPDAASGQWRIRHEHVSGALPNPYGIGDWSRKQD